MELVDGMDAKCEQYRRQLGGMTAAHNRAKQRIAELEVLVRHMAACIEFGGWPCNDCPYEDHECEKEWYEAMKRLGV